jgi:tripartite-type tricarboxylate transporter receptor subunit TctC
MTRAPNLTRRRLCAGLLCSLPLGGAWAQLRYPERPVRVVVPYSVGVGPDVVARSVAERLTRQWGQPVVVDNRPGASGIVAFAEVRKVTPDGYTLFVADTATMVVNPLLNAQLPYDPARDLAPLSLLFRATFVILVGSESRFRSAGAMLDAARRAPGSVSYGSLGNGHASHVAIESMARAADVRMLHVPFKEAGALMTAVANNDVDIMVFGMNTVAGMLARGKVRPLAVAASARLKDHSELPTLVEAGGPAVEMHPWAALVAVAGTPKPVLDRLQRDIVAALGSPDVRTRVEAAGFELTPSSPQELLQRIDADVALYAPLVREGRIAPL